MRSIRRAPMTAESLIVCVAVYLSCSLQASSNRERFVDVQRTWGAIQTRELSEMPFGVHVSKELELYGPLDVWNGEWWRIPVTAFHHENLLHLVLVFGTVWYLGSRLERRWGSFAMGLFLVPAICLPVIAELCLGQPVIGLSGAACAMLGALVVLQRFNPLPNDLFSEDAGEIGTGLIVIGWLATMAGIVSFPNAAHLSGFAYGALIAATACGPLRQVTLLRISTILVHLWLVPALFLVCHPFWIGRYHWFQAASTRTPYRAERHLERAISCDSSLMGAWLMWSQAADARGDESESWRRMIGGLAANPSSPQLVEGARKVWRHLDPGQRREAELVLTQHFGPRSSVWLEQIRSKAKLENPDKSVIIDSEIDDLSRFSLEQKVEFPKGDELDTLPNPQKPIDQLDQNDAVEGETL